MPEKLTKDLPIIGGVFTDSTKAQDAYNDFTNKQGYDTLEVPMYVAPTTEQQAHDYRAELVNHGVSASQAKRYIDALKDGRVLLVVYNVKDKAKAIETLNDHGAIYEPDGSRNLRVDVAGMTTGAAIGLAAGAAGGALAAGPIGAAIGAVGGEALGVAAGAAAGKKGEEG